jgi:hypothetical protein
MVPLTSSWTGSVFLVDTPMKILRAKMSAGLLHTLGLRACVLLFLVMLHLSFYLLLLNLVYVYSHGMSNSTPWILYSVLPVLIPCNDPDAPLWQARVTCSIGSGFAPLPTITCTDPPWKVSRHPLHALIKGRLDMRESDQRFYCRNTSKQFITGGSIFA